jgi:hypothetical protein
VQWREIVHLIELRSDRSIDHHGVGEPGPSVDYSVANGVQRSGRRQEATQVISQRVTRRVAVDGLAHTIVTFNDTKLETGRSGIDDEYPHPTVLALLQRVGFERRRPHRRSSYERSCHDLRGHVS